MAEIIVSFVCPRVVDDQGRHVRGCGYGDWKVDPPKTCRSCGGELRTTGKAYLIPIGGST